MEREEALLRIGELSRAAKVSRRTIDFYTRIGLLNAVRSDGNYRLYNKECVERLQLIQELKEKKFSLGEIRKVFELAEDPDEGEVLQRVEHVRELMLTLEREIAQLKPELSQLLVKKKSVNTQLMVAQGLALAHTILLVLRESSLFHQ